MSQDQLKMFVFRVIDQDNDEVISKKDLLVFFSSEFNGRKIFPINYLKIIEKFEIRRSDHIEFFEFKSKLDDLPFLSYPAQRIQDDLREKIMGKNFWINLLKKLKDYELQCAKAKQDETLKKEIEKIANDKKQEKIDEYKKMVKRFNQELALKEKKRLTKEKFRKRIQGRRNSDNMLINQKNDGLPGLEDNYKSRSQEYLRLTLQDADNSKVLINHLESQRSHVINQEKQLFSPRLTTKKSFRKSGRVSQISITNSKPKDSLGIIKKNNSKFLDENISINNEFGNNS